jgi:hypothetical protein
LITGFQRIVHRVGLTEPGVHSAGVVPAFDGAKDRFVREGADGRPRRPISSGLMVAKNDSATALFSASAMRPVRKSFAT